MIIQHKGKLTIKEIEQISREGDVLSNFYYRRLYPSLRSWWEIEKEDDSNPMKQFELISLIHGNSIAELFGVPNCNMRGYESYPGAWVFYDTEHDVRWLVFSDGIRKNHYKGTSYEITLPARGLTEEEFKSAIRKFFRHFGCFPANENEAELNGEC